MRDPGFPLSAEVRRRRSFEARFPELRGLSGEAWVRALWRLAPAEFEGPEGPEAPQGPSTAAAGGPSPGA